MRLFYAIDLPSEVREELQNTQKSVKYDLRDYSISWVNPEIMHMTLLFIGDASGEQKDALMVPLPIRPHETVLTLNRLNAFPNTQHPKVIVAEVKNSTDAFARLQGELKSYAEKAGCHPDYKPSRWHITLGRVKESVSFSPERYTVKPLSWSPQSFELKSSILGAGGPVYTTLFTFPLS